MNRISKDEKRRLKNHANRNIAYLLDKLGVEFYDRGDGLIQACCPCQQHGGDRSNHTAWSWRTDLGRWVCWSHHCEETRGNDVFGIVSSIRDTSFRDTAKWIAKTLEEKNVDINDSVVEPENAYHGSRLHVHEALPEDNLKFLTPDPQYLLDRGFDIDVLRDYEVGLWQRFGTYMHDRVVFPVRDHEGYLVGYTGRTVHSEEYFEKRGLRYKKWLHGRNYVQYSQNNGRFFTSSVLYNLFRAKRYLALQRGLILVEGPLDGMKLQQAGIYNWVATLGTSFCQAHRTLLVQHGVTDLYVAYDNDDPNQYVHGNNPGQKGWERMHRIVGDLFNLYRVALPPGKDCGDLDMAQLQKIFGDIKC